MLPKKHRILNSRDFSQIYKNGIKVSSPYGKLMGLASPDDLGNCSYLLLRFGFIVSKKVGNAAMRNKIKRHLRAEAYELIKEYDTSFGLKKGSSEGDLSEIKFSFIAFPREDYDFKVLRRVFRGQFNQIIKRLGCSKLNYEKGILKNN